MYDYGLEILCFLRWAKCNENLLNINFEKMKCRSPFLITISTLTLVKYVGKLL